MPKIKKRSKPKTRKRLRLFLPPVSAVIARKVMDLIGPPKTLH
jgi:hypothetical protein